MDSQFLDRIMNNPVIAAVSGEEMLDPAVQSPCDVIFLLSGSIFNLKEMVDRCKAQDKCILVHIDLLEGFSKDAVALRYIHEKIRPDGIITTKSSLVKAAKELDIFAIQRLFILDSLSMETGIKSIRSVKPDAIEIMPGVMPKVIGLIHHQTSIPLIAGGLIADKEDVINVLKAGAVGVSTSNKAIWDM